MHKLFFLAILLLAATTIHAQSQPTGQILGHDYVDLGLSVKWATCNIGANSPEDYGDYFAWGEAETKDNFGSLQETKYYISNNWVGGMNCKTEVIGDREIERFMFLCTVTCSSQDGNFDYQCSVSFIDAAAKNLGYPWRLPTKAEFQELIDNCKCELFFVDKHLCHKYTSRKNGNSIILPIAGFRYGTDSYNDNMSSFYWSSSFGAGELSAYGLYNFGTKPQVRINNNILFGYPIRPVSEK